MARHGGAGASLVVLRELPVHDAHTHRDVSFGVVFLALVLQLLLEAKAAVADEDVVDLLEIEINVVMMVRVLPPVPLALPLLFAAAGCAVHVLSLCCSVRAETVLGVSWLLTAVMSLPRFT